MDAKHVNDKMRGMPGRRRSQSQPAFVLSSPAKLPESSQQPASIPAGAQLKKSCCWILRTMERTDPMAARVPTPAKVIASAARPQ